MPDGVVRQSLAALAALGWLLSGLPPAGSGGTPASAQSMAGLPGADVAEINAGISSMLGSPRGQLRDWSAATGNRGQIRLGPAVDTVAGAPCTSWQDCQEPCRNVNFSFVGQDRAGRTVDNSYRAYYCLRPGGWTSMQGVRATQRVLAEPPQPPRTIIAQGAPLRAPPLPAPLQPAAAPRAQVPADLVRSLQRRLRSLLYYSGPESGEFDERTVTALRDFFADEGLQGGDVRRMSTTDLIFFDSRLRDAGDRGRTGACPLAGSFVACGTAS